MLKLNIVILKKHKSEGHKQTNQSEKIHITFNSHKIELFSHKTHKHFIKRSKHNTLDIVSIKYHSQYNLHLAYKQIHLNISCINYICLIWMNESTYEGIVYVFYTIAMRYLSLAQSNLERGTLQWWHQSRDLLCLMYWSLWALHMYLFHHRRYHSHTRCLMGLNRQLCIIWQTLNNLCE